MTDQYILALDLGSSSLKCAVISHQGRVLALARTPMQYFHPAGLSDLTLEFRADEVWNATCQLIRQCLEKAAIVGKCISAVGTTSQRGGMVILNRHGKAIYAGPNDDIRAIFEGMEIDEHHGEELYCLTGHLPSFMFAPARLNWFKNNNAKVFSEFSTVLPICDWLVFQLTGSIKGERSALVEIGMLPLLDTPPKDRIPNLLGLDPALMPEVTFSGITSGYLTEQASKHTGLSPKIPVVSGGPDTQCGLLGMNAINTGQLGILLGWSGPLQLVTNSPCIDKKRRTWAGRHIIPNNWVLESSTTEAGRALDWITKTFRLNNVMDNWHPQALDKEKSLFSSYQALAMLGPRIMNAKRLGIQLGGILFPVPAGHSNISRDMLIAASLKNLAFAIRGNIMQLANVSESSSSSIAIGGGVTKIKGFPQLIADTLGQAITVSDVKDSSVLGTAMSAATGLGIYNNLSEASVAMKGDTLSLEPNWEATSNLEEEYERWFTLYSKLDALAKDL